MIKKYNCVVEVINRSHIDRVEPLVIEAESREEAKAKVIALYEKWGKKMLNCTAFNILSVKEAL